MQNTLNKVLLYNPGLPISGKFSVIALISRKLLRCKSVTFLLLPGSQPASDIACNICRLKLLLYFFRIYQNEFIIVACILHLSLILFSGPCLIPNLPMNQFYRIAALQFNGLVSFLYPWGEYLKKCGEKIETKSYSTILNNFVRSCIRQPKWYLACNYF